MDIDPQGDELNPRTHLELTTHYIKDVGAQDTPFRFADEEEIEWNTTEFKKGFQVKIIKLSEEEIEFDLIGLDASVANAFRRILIGEVPSVAPESIYIWQNTSIVQDEVLSHRLGLIPIKVDPRRLEFPLAGFEASTDFDTIVFGLSITCSHNYEAELTATEPEELYINSNVYSGDLTWHSKGDQENELGPEFPIPVQPDILIAKLRPGQEILLEAHCVKGRGSDHAKFSPVSTASYRLLPSIHLLKPIAPPLQEKFKNCFPPGVIEIRKDSQGQPQIEVVNPRKDKVSREVLRHEEFKDSVKLGRKRDHFIFNVESTGVYTPEELLPEALDIFISKIDFVRKGLRALVEGES